MNLIEKLKAFLSEEESPSSAPAALSEENSSPKASAKSPALVEALTEIARLKADKETGFIEAIKTRAENLATAEISAGRMFPMEKADFIKDYAQAFEDDEKMPLLTGSRVEQLTARQATRQKNMLTTETINAGTNKTVFAAHETGADAQMDAEVEAQAEDFAAMSENQ
jgi:orotidine-5'-phosphate decarboxylase